MLKCSNSLFGGYPKVHKLSRNLHSTSFVPKWVYPRNGTLDTESLGIWGSKKKSGTQPHKTQCCFVPQRTYIPLYPYMIYPEYVHRWSLPILIDWTPIISPVWPFRIEAMIFFHDLAMTSHGDFQAMSPLCLKSVGMYSMAATFCFTAWEPWNLSSNTRIVPHEMGIMIIHSWGLWSSY